MKVKICGITSLAEAEYLNEALPDYAGFVLFFPKSKRCVTIERAHEIANALAPSIKTVAVTVSPTEAQLREIENAGFDFVQIHGDISFDLLESVKIPVLKAFNVNDLVRYDEFAACKAVKGFVFDAAVPGSGKPFDAELIAGLARDDRLRLLAGGLTPDNVASVAAAPVDGADVSSGVENDDGHGKSREKILRFVKNARAINLKK